MFLTFEMVIIDPLSYFFQLFQTALPCKSKAYFSVEKILLDYIRLLRLGG